LSQERLKTVSAKTVVMHPGPIIRGLEIAGEVADGPQSAIEQQVSQGLAVRRALLVRALGGKACSELLILNGRVVDPASGTDGPRDVLLRDGRGCGGELPGALAGVAGSLAEGEPDRCGGMRWLRRG